MAAAGSYLQARAAGGAWLLRMEDLDTPRVVAGAADAILHTLEAMGFEWDDAVVFQSSRTEAYSAALAALRERGEVFACSCSRRELLDEQGTAAAEELFYPGTCRNGVRHPQRSVAQRFRVSADVVDFEDALQGHCSQDVSRTIGDFILQRRDGLFAYQLAVVVDDAAQGITEVVRGRDLLSNTPRQILLQRALGLQQPCYVHLPLLVESDGRKLSKSRRSLPVRSEAAGSVLCDVLNLLGQAPPAELARASPAEVWRWAIAHWQLHRLRGREQILLEPI